MLEVARTSSLIILVGRNFTVATNEMVKIFISYGDGVRVRLCLFVCVFVCEYGLVSSVSVGLCVFVWMNQNGRTYKV